MFDLHQEPALNLSLDGTAGSFQVGVGTSDRQSLEVKYLLTHVGLNFATGPDDALLAALAPVREMFAPDTLDFDEIMQRDIDDARVSGELVPYLLDEQVQEMVKLFPPIVVVVLPVEEGHNRPADRYPKVTREQVPPTETRKYSLWVTRSGGIGSEVFQFEQPLLDGVPLTKRLVQLRINTHKTRLVIVDGQHRAMALLAIYRNLKDAWSDGRRAPFKEYYSEWTPNYIRQFKLDQIQLPVMLCTFPDIDENYGGDVDLKRAARTIFLTLNKNARKVSESRNKLLDDNDLIAYFMRSCLAEIKRKDERSASAMRIWNVELDQYRDKVKLQSPIAITGVSHVYYTIEHLMMENDVVRGIGPRSGKFAKRTDLSNCIDRLDGRNLLGAIVAQATRRDLFSADAAKKLGGRFDARYGNFIIQAFDDFVSYDHHCRAALEVRANVMASTYRELLPILFDGQGVGRVFEEHRQNLKEKLKENRFKTDVPEIQASDKRMDGTAKHLEESIAHLRKNRAERFLARIGEKRTFRNAEDQIHEHVLSWINGLYENIFTTVAFQAALVCGFFSEIDRAGITSDRESIFSEYIVQLSDFFSPQSVPQLKLLIQVLFGEVTGDSVANWKQAHSNQTFRSIVYRGEMQPDQWPKYKYLMLEIWKPSDAVLAASVEDERKRCRAEVFRDLYRSYKVSYCQDNRKSEDDLTDSERTDIFDRSYSAYHGFLKNLGLASTLRKSEMKDAISGTGVTASVVQITPDSDSWDESEE